MSIGLIGRKCGMTRIFTETGEALPVTAIEVAENHITQLKSLSTDGYSALQVSAVKKKLSRTNKPLVGHFSKANVEPCHYVKEFRVAEEELANYELGQQLQSADLFKLGQHLDVCSVSKGKGFAGAIKRHNFSMQDATHGNSKAHRSAGSIGQNQDPGKVFKGKKMAGQLGNVKTTVHALPVVKIDTIDGKNVILVKGSVPGATGAMVILTPSVKSKKDVDYGN